MIKKWYGLFRNVLRHSACESQKLALYWMLVDGAELQDAITLQSV